MADISNLKHQLERTVTEFSLQLNEIAESAMRNKPSPAKWSKVEILGHLVDSALNNYQRWMRVLQGEPISLNYLQNKWVMYGNYQHAPVEEVVQLWVLMNRQLIRLMDNVSSSDTDLLYFDGQKEVTLGYLMEEYLKHLQHHIRQIL